MFIDTAPGTAAPRLTIIIADAASNAIRLMGFLARFDFDGNACIWRAEWGKNKLFIAQKD